MARILDVRNTGGELVVLGKAITLPHNSDIPGTTLPNLEVVPPSIVGSLRYNPENSSIEAYLPIPNNVPNTPIEYSWRPFGDGGNPADLFVLRAGDTMTGSLVMASPARLFTSIGSEVHPSFSFDVNRETGFWLDTSKPVTTLSLSIDGSTSLTTNSAGTKVVGNLAVSADQFTDPTVQLSASADSLFITANGAVFIAKGDISQRPSPYLGGLRYNTQTALVEYSNGSLWQPIYTPQPPIDLSPYIIRSGDTFVGKLDFNPGAALDIPWGTTAERTAPDIGGLRFNTETNQVEIANGVMWANLSFDLSLLPPPVDLTPFVRKAGDTVQGTLIYEKAWDALNSNAAINLTSLSPAIRYENPTYQTSWMLSQLTTDVTLYTFDGSDYTNGFNFASNGATTTLGLRSTANAADWQMSHDVTDNFVIAQGGDTKVRVTPPGQLIVGKTPDWSISGTTSAILNFAFQSVPQASVAANGTVISTALLVGNTSDWQVTNENNDLIARFQGINRFRVESNGAVKATTFISGGADVAERYWADAEYEVGTVLVIGGPNEVTLSTMAWDQRVAGVVSGTPALQMNADAGPDATHPFIALRGRVPCKVTGQVEKGQLLVTSNVPGHAMATDKPPQVGQALGKALQDFEGGEGIIEIMVL